MKLILFSLEMASGGFGPRTGAGQVGRSSFAASRPAGGSEAPGPRGLGGGGRRRPTPPGPRGPEQRMGSGGGPAQRAPFLSIHLLMDI